MVTSPMALFEPGFHYGFRSNQAVVGVRTVKYLIQQEEEGSGFARPNNLPQPEH